MGSYEVWVKDITDLRNLGSRDMKNVAGDIQKSATELKTLNMNAAAFGENQDIQKRIMDAYEHARTVIIQQVMQAQKGMSDSGAAIAKVADHYAALEHAMSE